MRMFTFDPTAYQEQYRQQQCVHIRDGITAEFHNYVINNLETGFRGRLLADFAIKGKKDQALFEFPAASGCHDELFDTVGQLCGLDRDRMVLSERHIQAYEPDAAAEPIAHKDRYPSQVSVGLSINIPVESRLVLYPHTHREVNPFNRAADLNRQLEPKDRPEIVLRDVDGVEIDDRDRDVVIFAGSTTWHLRRRSAGTINLYFKLNDFGCDPLGEDAGTAGIRERSIRTLSGTVDGGLVPQLGRQLDKVVSVFTRNEWQEVLQVQLYGSEPVGITSSQWAVLRRIDGRLTLDELSEHTGRKDDRLRVRDDIVRLVELGAVDLP